MPSTCTRSASLASRRSSVSAESRLRTATRNHDPCRSQHPAARLPLRARHPLPVGLDRLAARQETEARRMGVMQDTRHRELVKCDGCGMLKRQWHRVVLSTDGSVVHDVQLCRACESDTLGAIRLVWQALETKRL